MIANVQVADTISSMIIAIDCCAAIIRAFAYGNAEIVHRIPRRYLNINASELTDALDEDSDRRRS